MSKLLRRASFAIVATATAAESGFGALAKADDKRRPEPQAARLKISRPPNKKRAEEPFGHSDLDIPSDFVIRVSSFK